MNLPNQLSLFRILLTPVVVFLLFIDGMVFQMSAFAVFVIASLTDWWDGYMARRFGEITIIGQFLDPLADKILISSTLICFSVLDYVPAWMVFIIVIRDFLMTGFRSYAILKGKTIKTSRIAKWKTFFQSILVYFLFIVHLLQSSDGIRSEKFTIWVNHYQVILIMLYMVTGLTLISLFTYGIRNRNYLRDMGPDFKQLFHSYDKRDSV